MRIYRKNISFILVIILIITGLPINFTGLGNMKETYADISIPGGQITDELLDFGMATGSAIEEEPTPDELIVKADYDWLVGETVIHYGIFFNDIRSGINLPTVGEYGSTISWHSSDATIIDTDGNVMQPPFSYSLGNAPITLTATIRSGEAVKEKEIYLEVVPLYPTDEDSVAIGIGNLTTEIVLNGNTIDNVKTRVYLPISTPSVWTPAGTYGGCSITWESSNPEVIVTDGRVIRPTVEQGPKEVTLTATISKNEACETKTFGYIVTVVEEFPLAINYNGFNNTSLLQFNGISGTVNSKDREGNDIVALQFRNDRTADESAGGSIITKNKIQLGEDLSFSTAFTYRNPHPDFTTGDGGFVFTMQPVSNTVYSQGLQEGNVKPSISIAFSTNYRAGQGGGQSTVYNYSETAAVYLNGDYVDRQVVILDDDKTNQTAPYYSVWVEYDGISKTLELRFSKDGIRPAASTLTIEDLDLSQAFIETEEGLTIAEVRDVYVGFMGSMGNAKDKSEITNWYFKNDSVAIDFEPYDYFDLSNVTLTANPPIGAVWSEITATVKSIGGVPVPNVLVDLSTTLGVLESSFGITDDAGMVKVVLNTSTAGTAYVKAVVAGGATATTEVQLSLTDEDRLNFDYQWLTYKMVLGDNISSDYVKADLILPTLGPSGSTISWESSNPEVVDIHGFVTRPTIEIGNQVVNLTATLSLEDKTLDNVFQVTVIVRDEDKVEADREWITIDKILGKNTSAETIITDLNLPTVGPNNSSISWVSNLTNIVTNSGTLNRPPYRDGNQLVTLTATIGVGEYSVEKELQVTVLASERTDADRVYDDSDLLSSELIAGVNTSIYNVEYDLYLPVIGINQSEINWISSNETWVTKDGKVSRPTNAQGDQYVTLTATIKYGVIEAEKKISIRVIPLATDKEAVALDVEWLTIHKIIGENADYYKITSNLTLPTVGARGSTITWTSSDERWIKIDGMVNRASMLVGDQKVTLTAVISKGAERAEISFTFIVLKADITDLEAVNTTKDYILWLLRAYDSHNYVSQNLDLQTTGRHGATIQWESGVPTVISQRGEVTRPEYYESHIRVDITAIITKGTVTDRMSFQFVVLAKRDSYPPVMTNSSPVNRSGNNLWNTREITITFDEEIKPVDQEGHYNNYGIYFKDNEEIDILVTISKKTITVKLLDYLSPGENHILVIPTGTITDKNYAYNSIKQDILIEFGLEPKPQNVIEVIQATPNHKEVDVSSELRQLSFRYNYMEGTEGAGFKNISLVDTTGSVIPVTKVLEGDTVILTLASDKTLKAGQVYELNIPAAAVVDRYENKSVAKVIKFRTENSSTIPTIVDCYPESGKGNVSIHQKIEVTFLDDMNPKDCNLSLYDVKGNKIYTKITKNEQKPNTMLVETPYYDALKSNMTYTLKGPYNDLGSEEVGFKVSFTTGSGALTITNVKTWVNPMPIISPMELLFSASIGKGPAFSSVKVLDSYGNEVDYKINVKENKAILSPDAPLTPGSVYTFYIPKGAFINEQKVENDTLRLQSTTGAQLSFGDNSFAMRGNWVVDKVLTIDGTGLTKFGRTIKSAVWDFGDGGQGNGIKTTHTYKNTGDYTVTLTLIDSIDITYHFEKIITINELSLQDAKLIVSPNSRVYIETMDESWRDQKNHKNFNIRLNSPTLGNIPDEEVGAALYKNGKMVSYIERGINTNEYGEATITFNYGSRGYNGNYEIGFWHNKTNQQVRVPITMAEGASRQAMYIKLYNRYETVAPGKQVYINVDGVRLLATYVEDDGIHSDYYTILNIPINHQFTFELPMNQDFLYYTPHVQYEIHSGSSDYIYLFVEPKQAGVSKIKSQVSDSSKSRLTQLIKDVKIPDLRFEISGDWAGLTPGYYELMSSMGSVSMTSTKPILELQPSLVMKPGERLYARMVSKSGSATPWKDALITVVPHPANINGIKLDISYVDGNYVIDSSVQLGELLGGEVDILKGIPLISGGNGFGMGNAKHKFEGSLTDRGRINILYKYSTKKSSGKKISKVVSTGYEVETEINFYASLNYEWATGKWEQDLFILQFIGRGEYFWKKSYTIPVIDVGGWGKITMGANVDATFQIIDDDFKGIIEFLPYVVGSVGAGIEGVLSVEGYVTGKVPAEFHIPTGYIQVRPSIDASIMVYYIYSSSEIYSKELVSYYWDNGKQKVKLLSLPLDEILDNKELEFTPMSRNYLNHDSQWLAESDATQPLLLLAVDTGTMLGEEDQIQNDTLIEYIYPRAEVELINGEEDWMVWTDDNPDRDSNNRTQLKYSVFRDGTWVMPSWFGQDDTADFDPSVVRVEDGMLVAWQNVKKAMTDETVNTAYVKDSEISVTKSVYKAGGEDPEIITLTDDDKFDHSPILANDQGNAILVWTKSEGLSLTYGDAMNDLKAPPNSDGLYYSTWNKLTWSAAKVMEEGLPTVVDSSLTMNGEKALLLYTLDMDNNVLTLEDREIYYKQYDGLSWSEALRLTDNSIEDSAPNAAYVNGDWFILWYENGIIKYQEGLNKEAKYNDALEYVPNSYQLAISEGEKPQLALIYTKNSQDNKTSMVASLYDINMGVWSNAITLCENESNIRSFSPMFTEEGILKVLYTQVEITTKIVDDEEFIVPSDKVDLKMVTYIPKHDLALDEEVGLQLMPAIPTQEAVTTIKATIINQGDFAEYATLSLYDGDPALGNLIGIVTTTEPIPARETVELEVEWFVGPEVRTEYEIYAVVTAEAGVKDAKESNDQLYLKIETADIAVNNVKYEHLYDNTYQAIVTISNKGNIILDGVVIQLEQKDNSQMIMNQTIQKIHPGQDMMVSLIFDIDDLIKDENGQINMVLRALLPSSIEEYTMDNNSCEFMLEPSSIMVVGINPRPSEKQVSVVDPITIQFNMLVEEGTGFDQIELLDKELNVIEIQKVINGKSLVITPKHSFAYETEYMLTIPVDAIKDSFGHKMDEAYTLQFITTSSKPEIIFAYPGRGMDEVSVDSEIMVKYNQNGIVGPTFAQVSLRTTSLNELPITVSLEGEWLYIRNEGSLEENKEYVLTIPEGAVKNSNGEVQQEDFVLEIRTGTSEEEPGEEPDGDNGSNDDSKNIVIHIGGVPRKYTLTINHDKAVLDIGALAADIFAGEENVEITIPPIPNINAYSLGIPVEALINILGNGSITFNTEVGSIRIPSGMLAGISEEGRTAYITIAVGDKTKFANTTKNMVGDHPFIELTLTIDGKQVEWNNPDAPVMVSIPYTPSADELKNSESIVVWYLGNSDSTITIPNGQYNLLTGAVTFITDHFSYFAAGYNKVSFKDVAEGVWYSKAISFIAARNITSGTGDENYSPNGKLTRGEFIVLLMRAYGILPDSNPTKNFADAGNTYYTGYLAAAKRLGITAGVGNNRYAPGKEITRQEMFTQLYNILKYRGQVPQGDLGKDLSNFSDAEQIPTWAKEAMNELVKSEIILGNGGLLNPSGVATRAEMAQVLYKLISKK